MENQNTGNLMPLSKLPVTAALLFGPRSHSFGVPKAFLPWGRHSLASHLVEEARAQFREVVAVAKDVAWIPRDVHGTVPLYLDRWAAPGPLAGLATVLPLAAHDTVFLMSCHQPILLREYIRGLWRDWEKGTPVDVLAPHFGGRWRPFRGLWKSSLKDAVVQGGFGSLEGLLDSGIARTRGLEEKTVRAWDPTLATFRELESPQDWIEIGAPQD